ncbi:putative divalent heavy-metal cations transporter [Sterolibacterium denitrificans]|uniref:ZIP zinc transporter n=2 Tax=Sterolibacterium denitrificans TaxID=157592 RepID=A0A656Z7V8_9PROT|nr:ZIP family metal transporter [Sterolibacterium denitrificans]KYC29130.1 ZIP zinc transporter [Sterolibacterium denitrificans]SMB29130.1 putative divalent heavy-metal cations transporter [Sterolibacterium denitrificans]
MSVLAWILLMSFAGGLLSVLAASLIALTASRRWVNSLVSYAIGALLGAAFLEVLPHAVVGSGDVGSTSAIVLAGILGFFVLEKLVLWRHCHTEHCEGHEQPVLTANRVQEHFHSHGHAHNVHAAHDGGRSGLLIMVGDTFHNFVDGILIAAAFMESVQLGIITSLAIIAHEIPQEVGDFVILLHSGYSRAKALIFNVVSSLATLAGGVLAYFALSAMQGAVPVFLSLAAASMIYVAVADLIPGLHKRTELRATLHQVVLIVTGILTIWAAHHLVEHFFGAA